MAGGILASMLFFSLGVQTLSMADVPPPSPPMPVLRIAPQTGQDLKNFLEQRDYDWDNLEQGVPRFALDALPEDLGTMEPGKERKILFFLSILPLALQTNEDILKARENILTSREILKSNQLVSDEMAWYLIRIAREYGISENPLAAPDAMEELLRRVDIIPASLLLAQSANESGYGSSRVAQMKNNLFGEYTFVRTQTSPDRPKQTMKTFETLGASVKSYVKTLNTHWAYEEFRRKRFALRQASEPLSGEALAEDIELYSTRGASYIKDIKSIIAANNLGVLSDISLRPHPSRNDPEILVPAPSPSKFTPDSRPQK